MHAPLANENLQNKNEILNIFQDDNQYLLNMKINREHITLTLSEKDKINSNTFSTRMSLNDLKNLHKNFSLINSCFDFSEYLKKLNQNNQLFINNKNENEIILSFTSEYLLNVEIIEIILLPDRINVEKKLKEACNEIEFLKQKIKNLENKNDELQNENNCMKNQIKEIINQNINFKNEIQKLNNKNNELKNENNSMKKKINENINININLKNEMQNEINRIDDDIERLINVNKLKKNYFNDIFSLNKPLEPLDSYY